MYDMCEILIDVLLSAAGALMWCVLITFCCMCTEHLLFKKQLRPRLTDKEVILIREVLAGRISLPLVANGGLFAGYVDRIEQIFERFITRSRQQMEQLEEISERISAIQGENNPVDFSYPLHEENLSGFSDWGIEKILHMTGINEKKKEMEKLLESPIYTTGLPKPCRRILQKKMGCNNVKDLLHLMLRVGNRKSLLKIYGIGEIYADKLEAFMFENGLIYLEGYAYKSGYEEPEKLNEPNEL